MSERQAKRKRQNDAGQTVAVKKNKADVLTNVIIVLVVIVLVGLGAWAVIGEYQKSQQEQAPVSQTVAEYAASVEMTVEDFLAEYGLGENAEVTADTDMSVATEYMTLGNYAKLAQTDVDTLKNSLGITDETINEDTTVGEIYDMMMQNTADEGAAQTTDDTNNTTEASE